MVDVCDPSVRLVRFGGSLSLSPGHITLGLIYTVREEREGGREGRKKGETQRGTEEKEGCCVLEGLPQQKDPSRVLSLPPPPGGHIGACVGWFVCCLFSFVCRNAGATTGEHNVCSQYVQVSFNGLYAQAFSLWVL